MNVSLIALALTVVPTLLSSTAVERRPAPVGVLQDSITPWRLAAQNADYTFDTSGTLGSPDGVALTARSTGAAATSMSLAKSIPADTLRLRRIVLSGRMKTQDVQRYASLWIRVDGGSGMLTLDNGLDRALTGTRDWTVFEVTTVVPQSASRIHLGLLVGGSGSVTVEGLRISTVSVIDPKAAVADEPKKLLDAAIDVAQRNSVWRDTISWKVVIPEVRELAAGAQRYEDAYPAIRYLVRRLGDGHSGFFPPAANNAVRTGGAANPIPDVRIVDRDIGLLRMEGYSGVEPTAIVRYANTVHSRLVAAKAEVRCGWIIDLRTNGGGNMNPMLGALRPFLGEGTLGYFISPANRSEWSARLSSERFGIPRAPRELDDLDKDAVAVLTGPRTASSGEIIAISFRGRKNTRSFGLPTGGYSTANSMFPLPGGSMLNLTTAIDADRNGVKFGHQIPPDERIETVAGAPDSDPVQAAAVAWLRTASKCAPGS